MHDVKWIILAGVLSIGGLLFLRIMAGARHAALEGEAERIRLLKEQEERKRQEEEREAATVIEVSEVGSV